jgi:hypothetical protein
MKSGKKLVKKQNNKLSTKHLFSGRKINVPSHPNEFTARPWFPLVVRIDFPGPQVTATDLCTAIASQLGIGTYADYSFRLQSVKVWGELVQLSASGVLAPLVLNVLDPIAEASIASTQRTLEQFIEYPDQVNRAACGFEYPAAQKCIALVPVSGFNLLRLSGVGGDSVVYFHIHWRSSSTLPAPAVGSALTSTQPPVQATSSASTGWFRQ